MAKILAEGRDLSKTFPARGQGKGAVLHGVSQVDLVVYEGETLALVGESGCGKSVTALSVLGLVPAGGQVTAGEICFQGRDLRQLSEKERRKLRGDRLAMIFQDPMTSLNPVYPVGRQVAEVLRLHRGMDRKSAKAKTIDLFRQVGIPDPAARYDAYPRELSGGLRQRVMIAMAMACEPELLLADEPTTALDVTIQAQILDLLRNLKDRINSSIMLITHDLGVIAEMADYVVVMYAGRVVEKGTVEEIFAHPSHPYTIGLMASKPVVGKKVDRLYSIPGKVPNPVDMPNYCYFKDRCELQLPCCSGEYPCEISLSPTHKVSCYRYYEENRKAGE